MRLVIIILSTFFWLGVAEAGARATFNLWASPADKAKDLLLVDGQLGWRQRPNINTIFWGQQVKTNELGLRDEPLGSIKPDEYTVLILGPSSTFGWGVGEDDTYASKLERTVLQKGYRVINAGQIGFTSWQGLVFYRQYLRNALKASVVIIAYGINDLDYFRFFYSSDKPDSIEFAKPKDRWHVDLLNGLGYFKSFQFSLRLANNTRELIFGRIHPSSQRRASADDFRQNIRQLISEVEGGGAIPVLLTTSHSQSLPEFLSKGVVEINEILKKVAAEKNVYLVDLAGRLEADGSDDYFIDPIHFSAKGHAAVATRLSDILKKVLYEKGSGTKKPDSLN